MGVVNTTYTFTSTDTITSAKMNNIIDETTFTSDAIQGSTLQVVSPGKLAVNAGGITSNELATDSIVTSKILNGSVTSDKLNAAVIFVPSGGIMAFAMNSAPTGWLVANGSAVSRTTYSSLWTALGTTSSPYGQGDGSTTFNLPDLRGYFVRGSGTNSDGTASGTFGAKQTASLLNHTHSGTTSDPSANHTHGYTRYNTLLNNIMTLPGSGINGIWQNTTNVETGGVSANHAHSFTTGNPSAGGGSETRPANIAMLYCIKI
jgi:microcystin-dependent protein